VRFSSRTSLSPNPIVGLSDKIASLSLKDLIPLQQGDLSMDTPREIIDAALDALNRGYTKYAPAAGYPELRNALAKKLRDYNQIDLDPETQILITQGSTEALYLAVNTLLDPGDEAIIPAPYYPPYDSLIKASGATPRYVGATEDEGWLSAPESIEKAINKKTRVLLINTPNNPTGTVYPRKYLEDIGRIAEDHDLPIISDEAYEALVFDGARHVSPMSIPSNRESAVGLFSFSKTFAMTGWRLGYVCGPEEFIKRAGIIHNLVLAHVSSHIQIAGIRALQGWDSFTVPIIRKLDERRRTLVDELNTLDGMSCRPPQGTFYVFPDFRDAAPGLTSQELADRFIQAGIGSSSGSFFGPGGEGYQRLSYSKVGIPQIVESVKRMKQAIAQHASAGPLEN
jgi:aspartate/methionine/tyrosine aminotransferase